MRFFAMPIYIAVTAQLLLVGAASATMGGPTIIARVDKDGDHKLSLGEVRAAAAGRYDLIESKNGGRVTMLQLGGRMVPADLKAVGKKAEVTMGVSKDEYLALVGKYFEEADALRKPGDAPGLGELDVDELGSDAGKKLVELLQ